MRTIVRFYTPWVIAMSASPLATVGGAFAFVLYRHDVPTGRRRARIVAVLGALGLFGAISVQTAADAFLDTVLYRHPKGLPVPGGRHPSSPRGGQSTVAATATHRLSRS